MVVPGATYAAMAIAAVGAPARVQDVYFYEPIILGDKVAREVQLTLQPANDSGGRAFKIHSRPCDDRDADWSLNAEGLVTAGADDAPTIDDAEPIDETCERLKRMRPKELLESFADYELVWGPTWATSLKSLWYGEREAVGDIAIGAKLIEQLGSEPIHPVLLDLCTGIAGAALMGESKEDADLALPLRYGKVTLRERMPKRFYCRAKWLTGDSNTESGSFDLEFIDRDGHDLGGIREFVLKRAPREALLRALGGDATRLLYTLGWREVALPVSGDRTDGVPGTWLVAGFDELAAELPGCIRVDTSADPQHWKQLLTLTQERGLPISGIVWRGAEQPCVEESSAEFAARLDTMMGDLLNAVHTLLADETVKLAGELWIVTERSVATESSESVDPAQAALWGFGRSIIGEQPTLRCKLVDYDGSGEAVRALIGLLSQPVDEPEFAVRQGKYLVPRLLPWVRGGYLRVPRGTDYRLAPTERGATANLRLIEEDIPAPPEGSVQVRVEAAGLNFRDVLNVLGMYPGDPGQVGGDFCGVVTALGPNVTEFAIGQRVLGMTPGSMASRVNVPAPLLARVPDTIDATAAAGLPTAVLTVLLSFDWAKVQRGDRVLIHAASGGVGLAAVQIAQQRGAIVFATASTYKRATLHKMGVRHVYDSRSTDFADQILADTDGAGVHVVLNSLTSEGFVAATVRATAPGGRFVEIAKRDIWTAEHMAEVRPDINYQIIALDMLVLQDPDRVRGLMGELSDGLASGQLSPLPVEIYPMTEAKTAFRRMQQARHIGKIVLQMPKPLLGRDNRSYLITGGLGALGLHTAAYLAQLGCGDIVLTSRREPDPDTQGAIAAIAERYRCRIHTWTADVGDKAQVADLLTRIKAELPALSGVAHLAGVIDDALIPQQSVERLRTTFRPKAFAAWTLHRLTRKDDLDFFVLYSSGTSMLGAAGQANYAAANAVLDGLAAYRKAQGLPATVINWGPWGQGGMASSAAARSNLAARGLIPLAPTAGLNALAEVIGYGVGQAMVLKANWQRAAKMLGTIRPPILEYVLPTDISMIQVDSALLRKLQEIPEAQLASFLTEHLQSELQQFLGLAQPPAASSRFLELGMDSLMAVEMRNRLLGQFGGVFTISATAVFDYPTLGGLAEYLAAQIPQSGGFVDQTAQSAEVEAR